MKKRDYAVEKLLEECKDLRFENNRLKIENERLIEENKTLVKLYDLLNRKDQTINELIKINTDPNQTTITKTVPTTYPGEYYPLEVGWPYSGTDYLRYIY